MRYAALLRGINVGGTNAVPMAQLRALFEEQGHTRVRTYVNSGNVVFDTKRTLAKTLAHVLEAAIRQRFGVDCRVLVLTGSSVTKIADGLPEHWCKDAEWACNVLYLLPERARPGTLRELGVDPEREEAIYCAGAILLRTSGANLGRSVLNKLPGTALSAAITIRNCNTARKLAQLVAED